MFLFLLSLFSIEWFENHQLRIYLNMTHCTPSQRRNARGRLRGAGGKPPCHCLPERLLLYNYVPALAIHAGTPRGAKGHLWRAADILSLRYLRPPLHLPPVDHWAQCECASTCAHVGRCETFRWWVCSSKANLKMFSNVNTVLLRFFYAAVFQIMARFVMDFLHGPRAGPISFCLTISRFDFWSISPSPTWTVAG